MWSDGRLGSTLATLPPHSNTGEDGFSPLGQGKLIAPSDTLMLHCALNTAKMVKRDYTGLGSDASTQEACDLYALVVADGLSPAAAPLAPTCKPNVCEPKSARGELTAPTEEAPPEVARQALVDPTMYDGTRLGPRKRQRPAPHTGLTPLLPLPLLPTGTTTPTARSSRCGRTRCSKSCAR